jgi:hypothetical protein
MPTESPGNGFPRPYEGPRIDLIGQPDAAKLLECSVQWVRTLADRGDIILYPWVEAHEKLLVKQSVLDYREVAKAAAASEGV